MSKLTNVAPQATPPPVTPASNVRRWQAFVFNRERRDQWLTTALLVAFGLGGFAMWRHVRGFVLQQEEYELDPANVDITAAPSWIRGDVRQEALQQGGLDKSSCILDDDLAKRVESAFAAHPWVERVDRVVKRHPAKVEVDLVYRRPVCMVELPTGYNGVYPVDASGVVLPTDDFTPNQALLYPRLSGVTALPAGKVGSAWGDACVEGGASVAAALADQWVPLKLLKIVPLREPRANGQAFQYQVVTESNVKIMWGYAPNISSAGEPSAADKVAALRQSLATAAPGSSIDLRQPLAGQKDPRTATRTDERDRR